MDERLKIIYPALFTGWTGTWRCSALTAQSLSHRCSNIKNSDRFATSDHGTLRRSPLLFRANRGRRSRSPRVDCSSLSRRVQLVSPTPSPLPLRRFKQTCFILALRCVRRTLFSSDPPSPLCGRPASQYMFALCKIEQIKNFAPLPVLEMRCSSQRKPALARLWSPYVSLGQPTLAAAHLDTRHQTHAHILYTSPPSCCSTRCMLRPHPAAFAQVICSLARTARERNPLTLRIASPFDPPPLLSAA